jgi:hypothetical protein
VERRNYKERKGERDERKLIQERAKKRERKMEKK